ncbi:ABC transporter permease [Methylicorpusculum sp.]|uniref:ABC transporter permease n=1 Tax=Methylicorpusculum sp. TaxID=2713644 RepID=UPI00271A00D5|nr:ABC transporter permease [Methylicorpusculum sp.]MDO8843230.1 ABC transporter permease [Methylicorpusculum sp.]MDP2178402.1 ABC transporter permease [Methylicorpusculum sp.]MDP3530763.1 ABC transporter permease [Methylicorpusculum sp.]MDZ4154454.1 ABC transporter permease [Methylicorpusculum sp.]
MVVLWTDALIYLLLICGAGFWFCVRGRATMQRPIRKVGRSKTGMVSLTVLLLFVCIGLLDSIHFRTDEERSNEIISLLDYWASPIRQNSEKTYSAPFSAYLFGKELMVVDEGAQVWGYPRLKHGAAHLADPDSDLASDVLLKTVTGLAEGFVFSLLPLSLLWLSVRKQEDAWLKQSTGKTVIIVVVVLISLVFTAIELSAHYHILGTDKVGEDVFYQAVKSIRTGLVIGTLTTLVMLPLAIVFGILAGFFHGWLDDVIQYIYTTLNSIPGVLLIAASILMVQVYMANHPDDFTSLIVRADMRLLFLCLILGVTSWTGLCRMLRAETLKLREMEYVQAARALGVKQGMILYKHILPNVMHIIIISVVLDFSSLVLAEAVLSYINIGVDPTTYSWGNMINGARLEMAREPAVWWSLAAAFLFMFTLVLAANLFADTVRDAFDPRRAEHE